MSSNFVSDYHDFNNPITSLGADNDKLTDAAKQLLEGDLVALAWGNHTSRTDSLKVRDLQSIEEAFAGHPFSGNSRSPKVGASCCCTCTPACCCTAGAVIEGMAA